MRSPASVSLRKSKYKRHHFNYFSVDYEEELSALYGPYLQRQTDFLHHAILRILKCYDHMYEEDRPKSVIAIGHSMGGLVIRGLFTLPTFQAEQINVIINLATPQVKPVLLLDKEISSYYSKVNNVWINKANNVLENLTFLSLGGGFRDYFVRSDHCLFDQISFSENHLSGLTTSIPNIWLENDHQCIVWCNQLIRALTRAFFNMIDEQSSQISSSSTSVLSQTLYHANFTLKSLNKSKLKNCKDIDLTTNPVISSSGCYWLSPSNNLEPYHVWATNTQRNQCLYDCIGNNCTPQKVRQLLPGGQFQQLGVQADVGEKHLLIVEKNERFLFSKVTTDNSFTVRSPYILHHSKKVQLSSKTFYIVVNITGIREVWQTYNVSIKLNRDDTKKKETYIKVAPMWSNETQLFTFQAGERVLRFPLKFFVQNRKRSDTVRVHIWREETTQVSIKVEVTLLDGFSQILRFNVDSLLRYIFVFYLYSTATQKEWSLLSFVLFYLMLRSQFMSCCCFTFRGLVRYMLPEVVLLTCGYALANTLEILIQVFLAATFLIKLLIKLLVKKLSPKRTRKTIYNSFKNKWLWNFTFIIALVCAYIFIGESICLVFLLLCHLLLTLASYRNFGNIKSNSTIKAILPMVLLFVAMPVIAYLQDIIKGYPHQRVVFTNLNVLLASYVVLVLMLMNMDQSNIETPSNGSFYLLCLIGFMFKEYVEFYYLTYLLVVYIVLVVFDVYSGSTHHEHIKTE